MSTNSAFTTSLVGKCYKVSTSVQILCHQVELISFSEYTKIHNVSL